MGAPRRSLLGRVKATNVVLVALAAGGAAWMLFVDRGAVSTGEATARKRDLFEAWRADDLTEVTIRAQGRTALLTRGAPNDAGQKPWDVMLDGTRYPAEPQAVDQYLGTLEFATPDRRVAPAAVDRKAMGLDAPRVEVTLAMGKQRYALRLGGPAPTPPGAVYAELEGHGVSVLTAELAGALDVSPEKLRSRGFVPYVSTDVGALSLDGRGGARHLTRAAWGDTRSSGFRFDGSSPEGHLRVASGALERIWTALGQMQAEAFLGDAEAERALVREVTLTLVPTDPTKPRGVVELGGVCPGKADDLVAVRREPTRAAACVPKGVLEALVQPAAELVDRHLFGAPLDEVTEVNLESGERTVDLARTGASWHLRKPSDRAVDATLGKTLLEGLLALSVPTLAEGEDPKALGLDPPAATARVFSLLSRGTGLAADGGPAERVEELAVSAPIGGVVHVRRLEDGATGTLPADRARVLLPSDLPLRKRKLFDEELKSVRALRVERAGFPAQRFERTATGGFRLLEPKGEGLGADLGFTSDVADSLVGLTVERWVADRDDGTFGLSMPRLVLEVDLGDKNSPAGTAPRRVLHLALGAPTADGSFARLGDDPAVFVAPKQLETAADRWLLDRAAMLLELGEVTRVTLAAPGGKSLVVEQSAGAFRLVGAPADAASGARAAEVRDGLNDLIAEGVVSVGTPDRAQGFDRPALRVTVELARGARPVHLAFGSGDSWRGQSVYYARREGVDATFALAQSKVRPFFEALGVP